MPYGVTINFKNRPFYLRSATENFNFEIFGKFKVKFTLKNSLFQAWPNPSKIGLF